MNPALSLDGISKRFDGFAALSDAQFTVAPGEVHALLGENGAGKSTLMNVASGLYAPDSGTILIDGQPVRPKGPREAADLGVGMVHQHFKLVGPFSVAENVLLSGRSRGPYRARLKSAAEAVRQQAAALGMPLDPSRTIASLSIAEQQRVEVIKALIAGARILILDEPTAVLTDDEAERLLITLRDLAARGTAIILVTHKLGDVKRFADKVTVMRGGRTVATLDPAQVSVEELTRLTVGEALPTVSLSATPAGRRRLEVINLTCGQSHGVAPVRDVSFHVNASEIYGLAGVSGNGQSELAEALMGLRPASEGVIQFEDAGEGLQSPSARLLRSLNVAFIPADRYQHALAGGLSVVDNYAATRVRTGRYGSWAWLRRGLMRTETQAALEAFDVQGVRSLNQKAALLSGGNAQKLVIAREFSGAPNVVIAQNPSRGLDARAVAAVHSRLSEARAAGAAVLLISEDLDEVLKLSDRVGVMAGGHLVGEFGRPVDRQAVGHAMVSHG